MPDKEKSVSNIFYNEVPSIYIQNANYTMNNLYEYNSDSYKLRSRYYDMPNVDPNVEITFETHNTSSSPENKSSHFNYSSTGASVAGSITGDILYDLTVRNTTENFNAKDITRQVYKAAAWETIQSGTVYGAAYVIGSEAIIPVKLGWTALEASAVLKRELDYLKEHNILTQENIEKAEYNALILGASGAFAAEIKFVTKAGHLAGMFTANATGSFVSHAIRDSYNYEPHEAGMMEKFFVFRTKYIEYPVVFVLGGTHDIIDSGIDWSADKLEGGYYWIKENVIGKEPQLKDIDTNYILEKFDKNFNVKSVIDIVRDKILSEELASFQMEQLLDSSEKVKSHEEVKSQESSEITEPSSFEDALIQYENQDTSCQLVNYDQLDRESNKIMDFISGNDIETIQTTIMCINNFNTALEAGVILKNWNDMDNGLRIKSVTGFAFKNFQSSTLSSNELSIIHSFGNLMMKKDITVEDFALFVASFPDTPLPIVDFLKYSFALIKGDNIEAKQAFLSLTLNVLALSNPVFTVGQVMLTTIELIKQLATKVKIVNISGIDAKFTDKVRLKGFFKKYHKCSMDNDFFGIHVKASGKHARDTKPQLEKEFNQQAFYKVYQVIGYPAKALDQNNINIKGRVNKMLWAQYVIACCTKWLEVNKKYLTEKEYEHLKRKMLETEEDKTFRVWLNKNGYENSWFSKHSHENPIEFAKSVSEALSGCSIVDGFKKFCGLFAPVKAEKNQMYVTIGKRKFKIINEKKQTIKDLFDGKSIQIIDGKPTIVSTKKSNSLSYDINYVLFGNDEESKFFESEQKLDFDNLDFDNLTIEEIQRFVNLNTGHKAKPGYRDILVEVKEEEIQNKKDNKTYERIRDKRTSKDNQELDNFNDSETAQHDSKTGKYSRFSLFKQVNTSLVEKHISVGYIIDIGASSVCNNIGSSIAYIDKEVVMVFRNPYGYICYKSEQLAISFTNSYITNSITNHLMTIPTILINENIITDDMLKIIAPSMSISVGVGLNAAMGIVRGKSNEEILHDSLNAGINSSLTTATMSYAKDTAFMTSLEGISRRFSTVMLVRYGLIIPQSLVSTIITSTILCVAQRIATVVYTPIYNSVTLPNEEKVNFIKKTTQTRGNNIFKNLMEDDDFFHTKSKDPFFTNGSNFGSSKVQECF